MREFLLAAESGAAAGLSGWDLALQYIIYGAVIVLSIVILILIRKRTRLPRHAEIKARLDKLLEQARAELAPYKYGKKESDDPDGISAAVGKIEQAVKVMQGVLDRDRDMKK